MVEIPPWALGIILLPLISALVTFLFRRSQPLVGCATGATLVIATAGLVRQVLQKGPQRYSVGGWGAPLGIDLYADGLSVLMLAMTAVVGFFASLYAGSYFTPKEKRKSEVLEPDHERTFFWPLWMFLWAALNALFLSADVFNIYVTLEVLGLSAVALVALEGEPAALAAAMRYLLVSLLGSMCFLLGVAFIYATLGTLDLAALAKAMIAAPPTWAAIALMSTGLFMKTALFPMHFWLPPAHANAPAPVSAILSALVVKATFYLLLRLWFQTFSALIPSVAAHVLGMLGAAAILWGSLQALIIDRLKLLVAYSTVAQIGYLFLMFPLAQREGIGFTAWKGGIYFVLSHAFAKAAVFLASGSVLYAVGHDRIDELNGIVQRLPISVFAFALAGVSLIGLPPSGGFMAKWMLLNAAISCRQWWWAILILAGNLLAAAYVFRFFSRALKYESAVPVYRPAPRAMEWSAFILAIGALAMGLVASHVPKLLKIGAPFDGPLLFGGSP